MDCIYKKIYTNSIHEYYQRNSKLCVLAHSDSFCRVFFHESKRIGQESRWKRWLIDDKKSKIIKK